MKTILSLCDYSGEWPRPYKEAGYDVIQVDIKHGHDIRLFNYPGQVHGVLCAPPCTEFAGSGAQWWKAKDADGRTLEALALVDACLRIVAVTKPVFWALENPVGRLKNWIGPAAYSFNPSDFAALADHPAVEQYTKKTQLWGNFNAPDKTTYAMDAVLGSKMWANYGGKSERTKTARSMTPTGFAKAFFQANP